MIAVKGNFLAMQGHFDPVAAFRVEFRAERGQSVFGILEVDVGADGMNEEGVQNLAVVMVHLALDLLRPIDVKSIKQSMKTSMTHIIWTHIIWTRASGSHLIIAGNADADAAWLSRSIG